MNELRAFMERHRLTQREVGDAIGVTAQFVGMLLSGDAQASLTTAKKLLAFCRSKEAGMTFEKLFGADAPGRVA